MRMFKLPVRCCVEVLGLGLRCFRENGFSLHYLNPKSLYHYGLLRYSSGLGLLFDPFWGPGSFRKYLRNLRLYPKGPKYQYGTKYGFCSSNFPHGLGKYSPYGYLGPFGIGNTYFGLISLQISYRGSLVLSIIGGSK